jgi:hypothetical protein
MPSKPSSTPVKKPAAKKAARKATAKKKVEAAVKKIAPGKKAAPRKTTVKKPKAIKPAETKPERRPRTKVLNEHPDNIVVDAHDHEAVDNANNPPPGETPSASMVERVSDAIERELSKIERIIGNPVRVAPAQRIETESRARVLASLARTLKEVMRLRSEASGDDKAKAADDDAVPRDLDEFRRELSRRLEGLVADAAPLSAGGNEPG